MRHNFNYVTRDIHKELITNPIQVIDKAEQWIEYWSWKNCFIRLGIPNIAIFLKVNIFPTRDSGRTNEISKCWESSVDKEHFEDEIELQITF